MVFSLNTVTERPISFGHAYSYIITTIINEQFHHVPPTPNSLVLPLCSQPFPLSSLIHFCPYIILYFENVVCSLWSRIFRIYVCLF